MLIIRDQDLLNPNAPPSKSEPVVPKMLIDRDGDAANNGTGFGKPAKDLSINFVPVPYPDYPPAVIKMKPEERQLWRVLNASAITYLNLEVLFNRAPQPLGLVALDGVPLNENGTVGRFCRLANPPRSAARGARGIHCEGASAGRSWTFRDANRGHRTGRRERSQPRDRHNYSFGRCAGAALETRRLAPTASSASRCHGWEMWFLYVSEGSTSPRSCSIRTTPTARLNFTSP